MWFFTITGVVMYDFIYQISASPQLALFGWLQQFVSSNEYEKYLSRSDSWNSRILVLGRYFWDMYWNILEVCDNAIFRTLRGWVELARYCCCACPLSSYIWDGETNAHVIFSYNWCRCSHVWFQLSNKGFTSTRFIWLVTVVRIFQWIW